MEKFYTSYKNKDKDKDKDKSKEKKKSINFKKGKNHKNHKNHNLKEDFISLKGGGLGGIGKAVSAIGDFLKMIADAVVGIYNFIVKFVKIIIALFNFLVWLFKFVWFLISDVFNPLNLIEDITSGSLNISKSLINTMIILIKKFGRYIVNNILNPFVKNIFGNDFNHRENKNDGNSKCYKTKEDNVPIQILIATILLPPLGVFMRFGLASWANILISGTLTILFYFPGLIYALIMIYSK